MRTHNFQDSLNNSSDGTQIVIDWIKRLPNLLLAWDVQDNPTFQKQDIDFVVARKPNITHTVEIKVDSYYYKSQNIFGKYFP